MTGVHIFNMFCTEKWIFFACRSFNWNQSTSWFTDKEDKRFCVHHIHDTRTCCEGLHTVRWESLSGESLCDYL